VNCNDAKPLIHAYADGELGLESALEIERHLEQCADCARERAALAALSVALGDPALRYAAPEALRRRVGAALAGEAAITARAPSARTPWWRLGWLVGEGEGGAIARGNAGWAVAGAALAILALVVLNGSPGLWRTFRNGTPFGNGLPLGNGAEADVVAREVLTSHLRSLMPGHLMDVISTDQHTVKPWFNGRLDLAPPVVDLTAQGFTLIGGRLDYLDGRAVACIVYRRRKHVINLFVAPAADFTARSAKLDSLQGYNICRWSGHGLEFFAVSDINTDELREFMEKFEHAVA
jgi:anti-sigma factor RsiW